MVENRGLSDPSDSLSTPRLGDSAFLKGQELSSM